MDVEFRETDLEAKNRADLLLFQKQVDTLWTQIGITSGIAHQDTKKYLRNTGVFTSLLFTPDMISLRPATTSVSRVC